MKTITLDDEYSYPLHTSGSISTLPMEPVDDTIDRLHAVVIALSAGVIATPGVAAADSV